MFNIFVYLKYITSYTTAQFQKKCLFRDKQLKNRQKIPSHCTLSLQPLLVTCFLKFRVTTFNLLKRLNIINTLCDLCENWIFIFCYSSVIILIKLIKNVNYIKIIFSMNLYFRERNILYVSQYEKLHI